MGTLSIRGSASFVGLENSYIGFVGGLQQVGLRVLGLRILGYVGWGLGFRAWGLGKYGCKAMFSSVCVCGGRGGGGGGGLQLIGL